MSELIQHECGIGLIRLKKPLEYFQNQYGTALWGLKKIYLLMEKQHNRGQDGAGLACLKLNTQPGSPYLFRHRTIEPSPVWQTLIKDIDSNLAQLIQNTPNILYDTPKLKQEFPFLGEIYLAHLRYGTYGENGIPYCHPVLRNSNWKSRTLAIAGNFNLTNVDFLFNKILKLGQFPRYKTDTTTILERMGFFLDEENKKVYHRYKDKLEKSQIQPLIEKELDVKSWLWWSAKHWDGGYVIGGLVGHGLAFVMRDPNGIRPCFFYENDEILVAASERPTICTAFQVPFSQIQELPPAHALVIYPDTSTEIFPFTEARKELKCSFERIYFSRGNDPDIYQERKALGFELAQRVAEEVHYQWEKTIITHIPNTSYPAYLGLSEGIRKIIHQQRIAQIKNQINQDNFEQEISKILSFRPRLEQLILKDVKLRTFISNEKGRDDLVSYVYDVTYGLVKENEDIIVALDDSIVRGTTLKQSIIALLAKLKPYKIVIVSSAPPICYPDCYGIDMSQIDKFIAFQAAIALLKERNMEYIIHQVYEEIKELEKLNALETQNVVKKIYQPFSLRELEIKIAELLKPEGMTSELSIIYQTLEGLHRAIPHHHGDWYFSGDYPTPGGNKVTNQAFLNFYEGKQGRAY
jgi:amidophosphoribosyltransferase